MKVTETPDLELEAQWQEVALVGSPQLGSPQKAPQPQRQEPPVSLQEQALNFKRRKGAFTSLTLRVRTSTALIFVCRRSGSFQSTRPESPHVLERQCASRLSCPPSDSRCQLDALAYMSSGALAHEDTGEVDGPNQACGILCIAAQ